MATKVTFTLDAETIERIRRAAERTQLPKSAVIREAVRNFESDDRISEEERDRRVAAYEPLMRARRSRSQAEVDAEIASIRRTRRHGGRLHRVD